MTTSDNLKKCKLCNIKYHARGLCRKHYERIYYYLKGRYCRYERYTTFSIKKMAIKKENPIPKGIFKYVNIESGG